MPVKEPCTCPRIDQRDAPPGHRWIDGGCPVHCAIDYLEGVARPPSEPVVDQLRVDRRRPVTTKDIEETRRDLDRIFPGMLDAMGEAPPNDAEKLPKGSWPYRPTREILDEEDK